MGIGLLPLVVGGDFVGAVAGFGGEVAAEEVGPEPLPA
jgi:hypothetical protein